MFMYVQEEVRDEGIIDISLIQSTHLQLFAQCIAKDYIKENGNWVPN